MDCTANGVGFTAEELRVLLKVAAKDDASRNMRGVHISVVEGQNRSWARVTDGDKSLELDGTSDGELNGEWFVDRGFLEMAVRLVVGVKAVLRLAFSGASLHRAIREENGVETGSLEAPNDAAIADVSFPWNREALKLPSKTRRIAHCSAMPGASAALLPVIQNALGVDTFDLYPPESPDHPWVFVVNADGQTTARGTLKTALSVASTTDEEGEEDPESEEKPKRRGRKARQQELVQ